jgi:hypothetical protein
MITALRHPRRLNVERLLSQFLIVSTLSTASLLFGWVPCLHGSSAALSFSNAAYAQDFTDEQLQDYVRAAVVIERRRQEVYNYIKGKIGSVPEIACHRPNSLSSLPATDDVRQRAVDYCNWAITVVENNNLTIGQFNAITAAQQSDPAVSSRIRCIQQPDSCPQ